MTTKESFDVLDSIKNENNPYSFTKDEWHKFTDEQKKARYKLQDQWKNEHDQRVLDAIRSIVPEVGLGCTICYWSDYRAVTITRIISPTKIEVTHNEVECLDYYGGRYKILPELQDGHVDVFTKRRNGLWCMEGQPTKDSVKLMLHYQRHYIDPNF